jgi:Protein of unknown function, DUF547
VKPRRPASLGAGWILTLPILLMTLGDCGAPPAVPLKGEAAEAVARGMASGVGHWDHARFDRVLKAHLRDGGFRFDYLGLKADPEDLNLYLEEIRKADLATLAREELLALLLNAYNACTIRTVLETFTPGAPGGVASIRDIPQVFDRKACVVGGYALSLNNLEHNLIRPLFKDPRIHFAVNCASVSCPPLAPEAFVGERLDAQLESAAHRALSSSANVRVEGGRLEVTKLFDWYGSDFVTPGFRGAEATLPRFIRKYAAAEVARWIDAQGGDPPVGFLDYDWSLNRAR